MLSLMLLVASLCITSTIARPNPRPAEGDTVINTREAAAASASAEAAYVSESFAYASAVSHFFATAEPTAKAAASSELAAESSYYAAATAGNFSDYYAAATAAYASESAAYRSLVTHFFATAEPTAKAAASSELAAQSSYIAGVEGNFSDSYAAATAAYALESAAYASAVSHFFATAEPTAKAAASKQLAAESSFYAAVTEGARSGNYSDSYAAATAAYASESAAYQSAVTHFFATAEPTARARLSSELAAETSFYEDLTRSLSPSEASAASEEYRQWTSEAAVYATYTGTSDLFGYLFTGDGTGTGAAKATSLPAAQVSAVNISQAAVKETASNSAAAPTSTADWPRLELDVNNKPASYAIQCLRARTGSSPALSGVARDFRDCTPAFTEICTTLHEADTLSSSNSNTDKWVWAHGTNSQCIAAFWLPKAAAGVGKVPTVRECEQAVYGRMLDACFTDGGLKNAYNMARVNIVHGLLNDTSAANEEGGYQGQQVDAGSPSYQVSFLT